MIDTDKYEGHTEGKWIMGEYKGRPSISAVEDVETPTWVRSIARGLNPSQTADHALLLDAPLLLAEVIRLREWIKQAVDVWENCNHEDRTDWFNNFCEVMKE
jgi:hypothetical protein